MHWSFVLAVPHLCCSHHAAVCSRTYCNLKLANRFWEFFILKLDPLLSISTTDFFVTHNKICKVFTRSYQDEDLRDPHREKFVRDPGDLRHNLSKRKQSGYESVPRKEGRSIR